MRWIAALLAACAAFSVAAAEARAQVVGTTPISGPTTAAIASDGSAAAAIGTTSSGVILVSRGSGEWREQNVSGSVPFARDAQVAVNVNRTVVAVWAQSTHARGSELVVAVGPASGDVRVISRRRVERASSAFPRLATLSSGRVLLAWRDGTRVRTAAVLGDHLGVVRTIASRAGTLALAASGTTAQLAWLDAYAGHAARVLRSVPLRPDGSAIGAPLLVSHAASGSIRVAGNGEPRAIVAWLRPGSKRAAFTRQVAPYARPARPITFGGTATAAAAISLADDGSAALTLGIFSTGPFGIVAANSQSGGVWTRVAALALSKPMIASPQAVALGNRISLAIWADAAPTSPGVSFPTYDIHVVKRDGVGNVVSSQTLPTRYDHTDGDGIAVAHAGTRTLIAYGAPGGGFAVSERTG